MSEKSEEKVISYHFLKNGDIYFHNQKGQKNCNFFHFYKTEWTDKRSMISNGQNVEQQEYTMLTEI